MPTNSSKPTPREVIEQARQSSLVWVGQQLADGEIEPFPPRVPDHHDDDGDLSPDAKVGGS